MRLMQIYGVRALQYIRKRRQHRRPQAVKNLQNRMHTRIGRSYLLIYMFLCYRLPVLLSLHQQKILVPQCRVQSDFLNKRLFWKYPQ